MDSSREHLMRCLARQIGQWNISFQESWLKDWEKTHSLKSTEWLRAQANKHRIFLDEQAHAKEMAKKKAAADAIAACRKAVSQ